MTTLTEFLLARIAEDEGRAESEREFHEYWPDTPACDSCNPARVLADVAAKRLRLAALDKLESEADFDEWRWISRTVDHLRALEALPYADHEDFDESWRP